LRKTLVIATLVMLLLLLQSSFSVWAWGIERPYRDIDIKDRVDNSYTNGEASVGIGVGIDDYDEDDAYFGDVMTLNVSVTANSRRGITYNYYSLGGLLWWDVYDLTGISGDDEGSWVDIPQDPYTFEFRFYGGWASAEYKRVWVCTNGFISFDRSNSTSPYPSSLPSYSEPNALIAALWADLIVDAAANITTGIVTYLSNFYFVISWNNVLHKASSERLTFQIILDAANHPNYDPANVQSRIWISYKFLGPISGFYTIGIEDHEGYKGAGPGRVNWDLTNLEGETLEVYQSSSSFFLKGLTIKLEEDDPDARVYIFRGPPYEFIRGFNVKRRTGETPEPDSGSTYLIALGGTAALLLGGKAGLMLGAFLLTLDWLDVIDYWMEDEVDPIDLRDSFNDPNPPLSHGGFINVTTQYQYGVDAALGILVYWIFDDPGNIMAHSLRITAELEYFEYTSTGEIIEKPPITTSVDLEVTPDDNDNPNAADPISVGNYTLLNLDYDYDPVDYYKINMPDDHAIRLEMEPPSYANYNLSLYDPDLILKASSEKGTGETETIYYECRYAGDWYIKVSAVSSFGFYNLSIGMQVLPSNNPPDVPSAPYGTGGGVGTSYTFYTSTTDPDGHNVCFTFDWDDGSNRTTGYYPSGYPWANASHTWSSAGTYNISVRAQDINGTWSESWSETTEVTITGGGGGGGGGGCPTLFSWNRTAYAEEALLDIHSNSDVTVDYTLSHLNPLNRYCLLSLRELDNYTSHIDYVKLYAVDNQGIWHECNLFLAWHSELGRVNHLLALDDDERVDLAPGERATLLFLLPKNIGDIQFFIFELNGHNPKGRPPRPL